MRRIIRLISRARRTPTLIQLRQWLRRGSPSVAPPFPLPPLSRKLGTVTLCSVRANAQRELDWQGLERVVRAAIARREPVVVDLAAVQVIDSRGLAALLRCRRHVAGGAPDLTLCHLSDGVRVVVELARLHHLFEVCNTSDEAVAAATARRARQILPAASQVVDRGSLLGALAHQHAQARARPGASSG